MSSIDDPQEEWEYRGRMPKPAVIRSNPLFWIIGFLKWLIWLFRRTAPELQRDFGRIAQPTIEAKNRVLHERPLIFAPGDAKLLTRANGEELPKYIRQINGGSAASPDNSDIRSTEKRPSLRTADNGSMSGNDLNAEDRYRVQVRKILERLPNIHALLDQAEAAGKQAWADFRFRLAHTQSPALMAYKGERQALRSFMAKHRLEGRAQQPFSPWLHYAVVLSFIFIETVLNGVMLARGMETGLIGGWGVACAVSFFNVALLGFISGGFALRQANHVEIRHKVFGVVVLGAIVAPHVLLQSAGCSLSRCTRRLRSGHCWNNRIGSMASYSI